MKHNEVSIMLNFLVPRWKPKHPALCELWMLLVFAWLLTLIPLLATIAILASLCNKRFDPIYNGISDYNEFQYQLHIQFEEQMKCSKN